MSEVGKSPPRLDGRERVTGASQFVDDQVADRMWFGGTVRSPVAHGRLRAICWDDSFAWDQVVRVTADDIPGRNLSAFIDEDQPMLASGVVRHVEEPVALIAAPTKQLLARALAAVSLDIEELPSRLDYRDASADAEERIIRRQHMRRGDVDTALAGAAHVIEQTYETGAQEQLYIEPQGMLAQPMDGGGVVVRGSMQCPYYVHKALKTLLGLPDEQVRVIQVATGGGFGGKEDYPNLIAGHTALLALAAGRPVKVVYTRIEDMRATTRRHPALITVTAGIDGDGHLMGVRVRLRIDAGAYATCSPVVLARAVIHAVGPYRCSNVDVEGVAVATNRPPFGAFRGFGAPQAGFAVERHMDALALAGGLDPADLRLRNALRLGDTTASGQQLTQSVGMVPCLEQVIADSEYTRRRRDAAQQRGRGERMARGVGLAGFYHGGGFTGAGEDRIRGRVGVELVDSGPHAFRVLAGNTDMGQANHTTFAQIAADALGVPLALVTTAQPDTAVVPDSGPTVASRSVQVVGRVVADASASLREALREWAAGHGLAGDGALADVARAHLEGAGPLRRDAVYACPEGTNWDEENYIGDAYASYGYAADVVEVEVDRDTLEVHVTGFWTAHEIGKAINPGIVEGQIQGGSLQGLGYGWMEEIHDDPHGGVANPTFGTYMVPTALDAPEMGVTILEEPFHHGPHGAKGLGELSHDIPAPALVAAVADATGLELTRIPVTPERLLAAARADGKEWPWS